MWPLGGPSLTARTYAARARASRAAGRVLELADRTQATAIAQQALQSAGRHKNVMGSPYSRGGHQKGLWGLRLISTQNHFFRTVPVSHPSPPRRAPFSFATKMHQSAPGAAPDNLENAHQLRQTAGRPSACWRGCGARRAPAGGAAVRRDRLFGRTRRARAAVASWRASLRSCRCAPRPSCAGSHTSRRWRSLARALCCSSSCRTPQRRCARQQDWPRRLLRAGAPAARDRHAQRRLLL